MIFANAKIQIWLVSNSQFSKCIFFVLIALPSSRSSLFRPIVTSHLLQYLRLSPNAQVPESFFATRMNSFICFSYPCKWNPRKLRSHFSFLLSSYWLYSLWLRSFRLKITTTSWNISVSSRVNTIVWKLKRTILRRPTIPPVNKLWSACVLR